MGYEPTAGDEPGRDDDVTGGWGLLARGPYLVPLEIPEWQGVADLAADLSGGTRANPCVWGEAPAEEVRPPRSARRARVAADVAHLSDIERRIAGELASALSGWWERWENTGLGVPTADLRVAAERLASLAGAALRIPGMGQSVSSALIGLARCLDPSRPITIRARRRGVAVLTASLRQDMCRVASEASREHAEQLARRYGAMFPAMDEHAESADVEPVHPPRALAPPGRTVVAVPIVAHAPPAQRVSALAA